MQTDMASQSQKATLSANDWQLILGQDPENFNYTGIDPHMVESYQDRTTLGLTVPNNGFPLSPASSAEGSDPISGREWVTDSTMAEHQGLVVDREYACIFKLVDAQGNPKPRDCSDTAVNADPTLVDSCDCETPMPGTGAFTPEQVPAVCNGTTPTQQDSAKAYPTIRELLLAKLMGSQGVISSLCPIHTYDMMGGSDPLYGYRPAMDAIVNALKSQLGVTCLPQRLTIDPTTNQVPCLVLGTFPSGSSSSPTSCSAIAGGGWSDPDPDVLTHFRADQHAAWLASNDTAFTDPSTELTCQLFQAPPNVDCSVKTATGAVSNAWCYESNLTNGGCAQAILFTPSAKGQNVDTSLQCLEQQPAVLGDGGGLSTSTGGGGG